MKHQRMESQALCAHCGEPWPCLSRRAFDLVMESVDRAMEGKPTPTKEEVHRRLSGNRLS